MQKRTLSQMYGNKIASGGTVKKMTLAEMYGNNTGGLNVSTKPTGTQTVKKEEPKDNGGPLGGALFVGEKFLTGLVSSVEGAVDTLGVSLAKFFGNDAWAEDIIKNDWFGDWYSHPEQWFNPSDGWKVAGDVAGSFGTSGPALAAAIGLSIATGGAAAPVAIGGFLSAALPAAGRGMKEAYDQTGSLGDKEVMYGALSGITEGSLEGVTNLLTLGGGAVVKSISKAFGKEMGEAAVKEGVIKTLGKSFIGEAFEESMSEFLDPFWKQATYDADAEGASLDQILYSGLVGGLSGMVMGGGGMAISTTASTVKGNKLANNGGYAEVLDTSNNLIQKLKRDGIDDEVFREISETREKLVTSMLQTDNKIVNLQQKKMLGELATANVRATGNMFVAKRALNIVNNAEVIAERMSAFGYKDANGKAMSFTADELTAGYDPKKPSSIYKALRDNSVLRTVAVADAAGALMIDTRKFTEATLTGKKLASQVDINRFVKSATAEEIKAVSDALKIDDWRTLTRDTLAERITEYLNEGGLQRNIREKELRAEFEAATPLEGYTIPKTFLFKKDGVRRFSDGSGDIGISKSGEVYRIFDYDTGSMTKEMTRAEVNTVLRDYDGKRFAAFESERRRLAEIEAMQKENAEIEELVRTNVKDYAKLSAPAQSQIERIVREGRAKGVSDSDVLMYAKVAAHSGLDIVFDKTVNYRGVNEQGEETYSDGFYSASRNTIFVNPEASRTQERLLIHELDHAIRTALGKNGRNVTRTYKYAVDGVREDIKKSIKEKYGDDPDVNADEANAYYAEIAFSNKHVLEKLIEAEPSIKEKILKFFKGASEDYADVPKLSGAAKRYYKTYKKLFDEFSARNSEALANEKPLTSINQGNMQVSDRRYAFAGVNADTADKMKLATAEKMLKDGADSETVRRETGWFKGYDGKWRFEIDDSQMEYSKNGFNPDYLKYKELEKKYIDGTITDQELRELQNVPQDIKGIKLHRLDQFVKHKALFDAYPELKRINITFDLSLESNGVFYPDTFSIKINPQSNDVKGTLIHEIQHAIQYTEGLTGGTDVKPISQEVKNRVYILKEEQKKIAKELEDIYKEIGFDKYSESLWEKAWNMEIDPDTIENLEEQFLAEKSRKGYALYKYQKQVIEMVKDAMHEEAEPYNRYRNTAGEIEARDVTNRLYMTEEQRKNTRPDIDRTDVVFAESTDRSLSIDTTTAGKPVVVVNDDLTRYAKNDSDLVKLVKQSIGKLPYVALGRQKIKFTYDTKREITYSNYTKWLRSKVPDVYKDKMRLFGHPSEVVLATTDYVNEGLKHPRKDNIVDFARGELLIDILGNQYSAEVVVGFTRSGECVLHDVINMTPTSFKYKTRDALSVDSQKSENSQKRSSLKDSISQFEEKSNGFDKNSLENSSDRQNALPLDEDTISGAEVLGWMKKKPAGDGKMDLEATVARGLPYKRGKSELTVGELRKVIANSTHEKVYSKKDALRVVNKFSGSSGLTVKAREEIADTIWQFLNEAPDVEYRADMAQDIAEFIVAKILVDSKTENPDALAAAERLSYLRVGIGKISFTDGEIDELRHAVDEKGVRSLIGRWGYKGAHKVEGAEQVSKRRTPMDVFVTEIAREMPGMEHLEEMHPVEAFLEIDKMYQDAYDGSKDKWISSYWNMPDSEVPAMISGVRDAILEAYSNEGEKSKFTKLMEEKISSYQKRAEYYKAERDEIKGRDKILGLLMNQATKMKDLKMGTYANATQHDSDVLRSSVERLSRIQFRGNLNVSGTRDIIRELALWYTTSNSMLGYEGEKTPGYYSQGIADRLGALAYGESGFTKEELSLLYDVMAYFTNFVETYRKVYRKGRWVDADVEAKRYVNILQSNTKVKVGIVRRIFGSKYMQTFGDPMTVARRMDMYEDGFFTEMMEELREGALGAQVAESEIMADYDKFLNENRKYIEKANAEEVVYHGANLSRMQLIGLYMTLKRKHARAGLAENGFYFYNAKGDKVRVNGFAIDTKDITEAEIDKRAEEQLTIISQKLTDTDKEYIKILEKAYNVDARKLKADRDMQRLGFTNAGLGYYYPVRRGNIAKNVDSSDYMAEMDRVTNSSFNKNTVRGARQELYIENADVVFRRHVRGVTQYAYLAPAVESYNMLYNVDISGNPNHPISVATESANIWDKGNDYFKKLISDIQGIPAVSGEGKETLSKIRSGYAKFQLGANPKVWFTQGSSLFASTSLLDADSIIKGATVSAEGLDKYCPLAKLRNSENTAAIAQAVIDTRGKKIASGVGRVGDALMVPIGKVDRFVISRLFGAAQVQVEKDGGAKVGTEQNRIEAGKLLEKVIFETQQNSIATERSAAMRSGSEFMKGITMFTSDSMKTVGRVIDGFGEVLTLRERIRQAGGEDAKATLEKRLKFAEEKTKKALGAMVTSSIYMACVAQLFRWLYDKEEDEDETTFGVMAADAMGNLVGGLPLVKDVISRVFLGGYELENNSYAAVNDLIDAAATLKTVTEKALSGELEAEERNRAIRSMTYSIGQVTGLPFRNVYNALYGLTKRFLPLTAFKIDSVFYKKNYQTELNKAVESGDNEKASFILNLILGERVEGNVPQIVFDEMLNLTKNGYKAVPRVMPNRVTVGGEEYTLSETEREAMKKIYSGAEGALEKLFSNQSYKTLDFETKVKLIDHVYDTYYAEASSLVLGTNGGNRVLAAKAVGADALALLYAKTKDIESDKDREGKTIAGSKRAKVVKAIGELGVSAEERLLLICASGYSLKDGDIRGVSAERAKTRLLKYILNLKGVSAAEKAEIAEMCGFEVKNGRIVRNSAGALSKMKV